jgi:hypothetical protein
MVMRVQSLVTPFSTNIMPFAAAFRKALIYEDIFVEPQGYDFCEFACVAGGNMQAVTRGNI